MIDKSLLYMLLSMVPEQVTDCHYCSYFVSTCNIMTTLVLCHLFWFCTIFFSKRRKNSSLCADHTAIL